MTEKWLIWLETMITHSLIYVELFVGFTFVTSISLNYKKTTYGIFYNKYKSYWGILATSNLHFILQRTVPVITIVFQFFDYSTCGR
jgi:hypothetical protein